MSDPGGTRQEELVDVRSKRHIFDHLIGQLTVDPASHIHETGSGTVGKSANKGIRYKEIR